MLANGGWNLIQRLKGLKDLSFLWLRIMMNFSTDYYVFTVHALDFLYQ